MSKEVFRTVQVGDTVHYLTPQGQNGKGKVVIHAGEHVVVNRGKGQPQVVTAKNYSHHTRGGKVIGALLSNLAQHGANERRAKKAAAALKATNAAAAYKIGEPQMNAAKAFGWVKEDYMNTEPHKWDYPDKPEGVLKLGKGQKAAMRKSAKDHDALLKKLHGKRPVKEATWQGAEETINELEKRTLQSYDAKAKNDLNSLVNKGDRWKNRLQAINRVKGLALSQKKLKDKEYGLKEDRSEAEGRGARVEKTKHKKKAKKLDEVSKTTLTNYVYKAIQDRKKNTIRSKNAWIIHGEDDPERASSEAKAAKQKADKRHAGIKKAVAKIASHLPAEPLKKHADNEGSKHGGWSGMNEVSAPGKEAWIKANKQRFIDRYGKEKGLRVLYAKAWKDAKNESVVNEGERAGKARAAERSWASDLADKSPNLAKGAGKPEPGYHYRVGGKTVSVHAHPQDALSAYKKGGSTGKIVHVKEGVETDVTTQILSEDKVKQAAAKAISLAKKAKSNKHVDTEPRLDIVDKGTHGPIEGNEEGGHSASL